MRPIDRKVRSLAHYNFMDGLVSKLASLPDCPSSKELLQMVTGVQSIELVVRYTCFTNRQAGADVYTHRGDMYVCSLVGWAVLGPL